MKDRAAIGVFFILCMYFNGVSGQNTAAHASNRLMAQFKENTSVQVTEKGFITIENHPLNALLQTFYLEKIAPCSRTGFENKAGSIVYNRPITLHFGKDIPAAELVEKLMQTGVFKFVEPDFAGTGGGICEVAPDDTYYESRQWGLNNTGDFNGNSVEDADIDMNHAWRLTTGSKSVIVATLDSGLDLDNIEFKDRIWNNSLELGQNAIDDDNNGFIDDEMGWDFAYNDNDPKDDHGHGTGVTGIIGASKNSLGYVGVDWNCKLMTCKVLDADNRGFYSWFAQGIYYAVDNGADVINMSLAGSMPSSALEAAIAYAYKENVPIVAAMSNENNGTTMYPAGYTKTIAVGATDTDNRRVSPFFWGGGSNYGKHIDLCAPGNYIYGLSINNNFNTYWGGTSQATPLVTGVIALIKGLEPNISIDSIETLLRLGATDQVGRSNEDLPGWDRYHGHGVLNAYKTLLLVKAKTVSACNGHTLSGQYFDSSVIHFDTLAPSTGCSSVMATILNIQHGPRFEYEKTACDSFHWVDGKTYKSSASDVKYFSPNPPGCDSMHLLNLDIRQSSSSMQQATACSSYTWIDGKTYTQSDTSITYIVPNQMGCDSTISLYLDITIAKGVITKEHTLSAIASDATYQWLDCDAAKALIPSENKQEFSPAKSGNYAVVIEKEGCTDTSDCYHIISSNLERRPQRDFVVYPNPFTDHFKITTPQSGTMITVTLMSNLGETLSREVYHPNTDIIYDLSEKPSGIYYAQIGMEDQGVVTYKVVKR